MASESNNMDSQSVFDSDMNIQSTEAVDSPMPTPGVGSKPTSYRQFLSSKQYKRRRMYKLAWKTLMTQIEDASDEDADGSDDLFDESEEELGNDSTAPKASEKVLPTGGQQEEIQQPLAPAENEEHSNVLYRAEFYRYLRTSNREQKPQFAKSIEDHKPIVTTRTKKTLTKSKDSCFEVATMYAIPKDIDKSHIAGLSSGVLAELGTYITIRSKFILDCLQDMVQYYPHISFQNDELVIAEPFCMLLHYRQEMIERCDELKRAASAVESIDKESSSVTHKHLAHLTHFIEERYANALSREFARHHDTRAMCTYDWVWLLFRPGSVVYAWKDNVLRAFIVETHNREVLQKKDGKIRPNTISTLDDLDRKPRAEQLAITVWLLDFDGEHLGRRREYYYIPAFDGEKPILSLPIFPKDFLKHDKRVHGTMSTEEYLVQRGQLFFEVTKRSYRQYDGETTDLPRRTVRGRVMVDTKYFYDSGEGERVKYGLNEEAERQETDQDEGTGGRRKPKNLFQHYDDIDPATSTSLEPQQYLICYYKIWAFVLKTRQWERVDVNNIQKPAFQVDLIKDLVLDDDAKAMIKALSQRYTMQKEPGDTWSADFVRNKGEGQIFLLHGKPGVGKTTTAECVAELTQRPLLSLTCGDLGIEPIDVEKKLMTWLKVATSWEAILLLDEADVYLESRISQDLQRNTLVSIFLRALEYYQGLLFLTTNRVGTFDDGFVSRIHVVIHYPDFTNEKRGQIWDIFFNKLERERENIKFTQRTVEYAKESKDMQGLGWNGREIRNAFNTAIALAEYENERDGKQRIVFHARHLEQVVKMSKAFQDYLSSTHGMSQAEQARRYRIRNDYWKGPNEDNGGSPAPR